MATTPTLFSIEEYLCTVYPSDPTNLTVAETPIQLDLTKAFAAID